MPLIEFPGSPVPAFLRNFQSLDGLKSLLATDDPEFLVHESLGATIVSIALFASGSYVCFPRQLDMSSLITGSRVVIPESGKITTGRFAITGLDARIPVYSACRRFQKNVNVNMSVETFLRHNRETGMTFDKNLSAVESSARFWSQLESGIREKEMVVFDYASREVTSLSQESGLSFDDIPCIVRSASRDGLLTGDGSAVRFPGVTSWYSYRGSTGSVFAFHREDMRLYSVNFLASGDPKVWYLIPPSHYQETLTGLRSDLMNAGVDDADCDAFEMHKCFLVKPEWFEKRKIPVYVLKQNPGQAVVIHPLTLHQGYNTGLNLAFATNFGTEFSLQHMIDVPVVSFRLIPGFGVTEVRFLTLSVPLLQSSRRRVPGSPTGSKASPGMDCGWRHRLQAVCREESHGCRCCAEFGRLRTTGPGEDGDA